MSDLDDLRFETRSFAAARDWFQFHTPKNLAMAIAGEAGELGEAVERVDYLGLDLDIHFFGLGQYGYRDRRGVSSTG